MTFNSNYSEDTGYVNIHGEDVKVFTCDKTGRILIPIDELKGMGFRIYRKSQYSRLLIDENQFNKEFNMFMLQSAQTYMLENKIAFDKNIILDSISKCKSSLIGDVRSPPKSVHEVVQSPSDCHNNSFGENRVVEDASNGSFTVSTNLRQPRSQNYRTDSSVQGFTKDRSPQSFVKSNPTSDENLKRKDFRPVKDRVSFDQKLPSQETNNTNQENKPQRNGEYQQTNGFADLKSQHNKQESQRSQNEIGERIPPGKLDKPVHNVVVSFIEKPNIAWVQDLENVDTLMEINEKAQEEADNPDKKMQRYVLNKIYLASFEDMWCRCKVIKFKPQVSVFFVDYGNTADVSDIREASAEISKIPVQAARITFQDANLEVYEKISIKVKKTYDNGTYLVDILKTETNSTPPKEDIRPAPPKNDIRPAPPKEATFFTKPRPLGTLQNGQRVMIVSHTGGKLVLRTKECHEKLKQIETANDGCTGKPLDNVKVGQIVLCKTNKTHRAVVCNVSDKKVEVELLDYYEKVHVDISKIRNISESLAKEPITCIVTPVVKNYNGSDEILEALAEKGVKGTVVLSNGVFDLDLNDALLSEKLKPTKEADRLMLTKLARYKPPLGPGVYFLNVYIDKDELYFVSPTTLEENLEAVIKSEMDDTEPYEPIVGEVCLGLYQENWCRCVLLRHNNSGYSVLFIDFGNKEILKSCDLRKLDDEGKETPVLAFRCRLIDLPDVDEDVLKEHFNEGEPVDIDIKKAVGDKFEIVVPAIYKAL